MNDKRFLLLCMTIMIVAALAVVTVGLAVDKITGEIVQKVVLAVIGVAGAAGVWKASKTGPNGNSK